jgi:hypothetical protein
MAVPATSAQIEAAMTSIASSARRSARRRHSPMRRSPKEASATTTYSFLEIANGTGRPSDRLAVAGMHAAKWAQPDAVISFGRS